ncbi:Iron-sulfur cluster assembly ATPase protein SufC [hydrothermal vent metagenome]|uniref:Iron-sulfur cluster assembly ATPase protein SufC n=1 Tax=hydrothermal vent metagenome TaxID=652676 RepID=A0A3B1BTW0_9ZZZZ
MLEIKDLHAQFEGKEILKGVSLTVNKGEVHSIMGPNGSGKSTLSKALAGYPSFKVTKGAALLNGKNILEMEPEERAMEGLFIGFQNPVEVPGVLNTEFLRMMYNARAIHEGKDEADPLDFEDILSENLNFLGMDNKLRERYLNDGFSGGEKKKNEILQMAILKPKLAILDEIDSGLDVDALKMVASGVNKLMNDDTALIVITHYQRLLDYIKPDYVHIFQDGKIVKSGGKELALELDEGGYASVTRGAS